MPIVKSQKLEGKSQKASFWAKNQNVVPQTNILNAAAYPYWLYDVLTPQYFSKEGSPGA
jgi:hypothetical protein